jgi:uncharacterized protein YoxC
MKELEKLRREIKADFELMYGYHGDLARRMEKVEQDVGELKTTVTQMQTTVTQMQTTVTHLNKVVTHLHKVVTGMEGNVHNLYTDVQASAEICRKMDGQMRKTGERFDKILRLVTEEFVPMTEFVGLEARMEARFADLERRLSA